MITIVIFRAFDKELEKNFYSGETVAEIHSALYRICHTYVPVKIITSSTQENTLMSELLKYQSK